MKTRREKAEGKPACLRAAKPCLLAMVALASLTITVGLVRADADVKATLRQRLSAIHAAEKATLAEGKFVLGAQHVRDLGTLACEIAVGQHWEFVPDLMQVIDRHRGRFRDVDVAGWVEPTWLYADALKTLAVSGQAQPYLIELARSVNGPLWKMTVLDGIASAVSSLKTVDEPSRKVLAAVVTELSTGPLGTAPTRSVQILKEALDLTSPMERLIYAHAKRTAEDEGFLAVNAIEFANKIGDGNSECHITTVSSGGAGARHWRHREMLWVFQSPGSTFNPTKARLVFSGVAKDALRGNINNESAVTTYRFHSSGSRVGAAVNWPLRQPAELNDRIEAVTTTTVWKEHHDENPTVRTTRAEYVLQDGRYVSLPQRPTADDKAAVRAQ